ncbi:Gibberellin-regulated protein 6 [Bienertia sinuspersici]
MAMSRNLTLVLYVTLMLIVLTSTRMWTKVYNKMLSNPIQEAMHVFLSKMLCYVLVCPPGTYGNKQLCPCYNNWKTKRGGPKCP